jgi:hypothetical protein
LRFRSLAFLVVIPVENLRFTAGSGPIAVQGLDADSLRE